MSVPIFLADCAKGRFEECCGAGVDHLERRLWAEGAFAALGRSLQAA